MLKKTLLVTLLTFAAGGSAQAATIVNGSFEDGVDPGSFSTQGAGSTAITGWSISGGTVDYIGSYWNASDGSRSIDLNGNGGGASIYQAMTDLVVNQKYRLSFDLSSNTDGGPVIKTTRAGVNENAEIFISSSATPRSAGLTWSTYSFDFWAAGTSTNLIFASQDQGAYGAALDNVVVSAVPVPASGLLLLAAIGGIAAGRRRRKAV